MIQPRQGLRVYERDDVVSFRKTSEAYGALSNMAPGFPIRVDFVKARTTEALYQACRFPNDSVLQEKILLQKSPMTAKMVTKPFRSSTRPDWDAARIRVMRWCLRLKLTQHWDEFGRILESTGDQVIVENSRKDTFWGAVPDGDAFVGHNVLGRLLMELRVSARGGLSSFLPVFPPEVPNFLLLSRNVPSVDRFGNKDASAVFQPLRVVSRASNNLGTSRDQILEVVEREIRTQLKAPMSMNDLAIHLGVNLSQMREWMQHFEQTGLVRRVNDSYAIDDTSSVTVADQMSFLVLDQIDGC